MQRFKTMKNNFSRLACLTFALGALACSRESAAYKEAAPQAPVPAAQQSAPSEIAPVAVEKTAAPTPAVQDSGSAASQQAIALDYSCGVDADCEVKDVGNCCGRMPACVNRAALPDPAAVQRECERTGSASICGFQELAGCRCEADRCVGVPSAAGGGGDVR